jgi:hypothetical protein
MRTCYEELTVDDALSDPLIQAVMAADRVDSEQLESMLISIARRVTPSIAPSIDAGCDCPA